MFRLILTLLIVITSTIFAPLVANAAPYGAGKYNASVPYGGETQLTISSVGPPPTQFQPVGGNFEAVTTDTVTVATTDVNGFKLYVNTVGTSNMTSGTSTIPSSTSGFGQPIPVNTWGYTTNYWSPSYSNMKNSPSSLIVTALNATSGLNVTFTYKAVIDNLKAAGTYTVSVVYTAVPSTN